MAKGEVYIGQLDELIAFEQPVETDNPTGGKSISWETAKANVWAKVEYMTQSDEQQIDAGLAQVVAFNRMKFTFWYDPDFTPTEKMRIIHDGQPCDILVLGKVGKNTYRTAEAVKRDNDQ